MTDVPSQTVVAPVDIDTLTGRGGLTTMFLERETPSHVGPVAVSVKTTIADDVDDAVYVAVFGVLPSLLVNEPPAKPSDHTALVAGLIIVPPRAAEVPP